MARLLDVRSKGKWARASLLAALCVVMAWCVPSLASAGTFTNPAFESITRAGGLDFPTTVTWAPDGRMFIAEKYGYVRVLNPDGTLLPNAIVDIHGHTVNSGDRGLLGLAAAPISGSSDIYLYMLYTKRFPGESDNDAADTTLAADSTLTRVRVHSDNTVIGGAVNPTETVILGSENTTKQSTNTNTAQGCAHETDDCIPSEGYTHTIGTVLVDPHDGSLWVSTGDGYSDGAFTDLGQAPFHLRAQDPSSLAGKILHIQTNGKGFAGSPFCAGVSGATTDSNCSKVWAEGFRNPFRIQLRKLANGTYQPIGGDVGEGNWEELNDITRGYNGGWPCYEGNAPAGEAPYSNSAECQALGTKYNHPFYLFSHYEGTTTDFGGAIVGGPVYSGNTYPATYRGKEFSTDYVHGWIRYHNLTSSNPQTNFTTFLTGVNGGLGSGSPQPLVSLVQAPDGNLVDVQIYGDSANPGPGTGLVNEIKYSPSDKAPIARATTSASCVDTNTTTPSVHFSGDGSIDPDGDKNLTYTWYFGDGATDSGTGIAHADPTHTYPTSGGTYLVRLKVTDSKGNSNNAFLTLHIGPGDAPPNASIQSPTPSKANPGPQDPSPDQYIPGEEIHLSGSTTSGAGSQMSWLPVLVHGGTHTHVLGSIPTPTGDVPDTANGVPPFIADSFHGADSWYIVYFTVTKNGCSTTKSELIRPQTGPYRMNAVDQSHGNASIPVPMTFIHTSLPATHLSPAKFTVAKNAIATASAPKTWVHGGYTYTFKRWVIRDSKGSRTPSPASNEQEIQPYHNDLADTSVEGATAYYVRSNQLRLHLSHSRIRRPRSLSGTLTGGGRPSKLQVAIRPAKLNGKGCLWWSARKHRLVHVTSGCSKVSWLTAKTSLKQGVVHWTLGLGARLPPKTYRIVARAQYGKSTLPATSSSGIKLTVTR